MSCTVSEKQITNFSEFIKIDRTQEIVLSSIIQLLKVINYSK